MRDFAAAMLFALASFFVVVALILIVFVALSEPPDSSMGYAFVGLMVVASVLLGWICTAAGRTLQNPAAPEDQRVVDYFDR